MNSKKYSLKHKNIWVAGHNGMVGKALINRLKSEECKIITIPKSKLDLTNQQTTWNWMENQSIDIVFLAAAKVGGIFANSEYPAEFIYDNICIATNIIKGAHIFKADRLVFLGSSCIYPKFTKQPIREESLLSGHLESTNEPYAIAKIAGLKMCQAFNKQYKTDFISVMPTNLYGKGDNFHPENSHVMASLIRKISEAKYNNIKEIEIWGSGTPRREFLHVDDLADSLVFLCKNYFGQDPINIGSGKDISIIELAVLISKIANWQINIKLNHDKPDGTPLKRLDISRINSLGWKPNISLKKGIAQSLEHYKNIRKSS